MNHRIALVLILILTPGIAYPHGGGLDKYGCHHDYKQHTYHCHQGALAGKVFSSQEEMLGVLPHRQDIQDQSYVLSGKVISITDGDTVKILVDNRPIKIRLAEIDAPEKGQDYGMQAKKYLGNLIFGKEVKAKIVDKDKYGRLVARLYLGNLDVNADIVEHGYAWAYLEYLQDRNLIQLESDAKSHRRGLWASDIHVPPWEWRHRNH